jgi:hypothetical protein
MNWRLRSSWTAITRVAACRSNSLRARISTICALVRSLMPISTVPLPTGITSPPSIEARPKSWMSNSSLSSL